LPYLPNRPEQLKSDTLSWWEILLIVVAGIAAVSGVVWCCCICIKRQTLYRKDQPYYDRYEPQVEYYENRVIYEPSPPVIVEEVVYDPLRDDLNYDPYYNQGEIIIS